jgi:hypothetical protein
MGTKIALSAVGIVILSMLLALPITMLVIGIQYRDARYCPIEPNISPFLIVGGATNLVTCIFMILLLVSTIVLSATRSVLVEVLLLVIQVLLIIVQLFSFIWIIVGSVWTFSVKSKVQYNNPYWRNFCQPLLYKFTFVYLIIAFILLALQICCNAALATRRDGSL